MSTRRRKKEESAVDFFFEMMALGRQSGMQERDVLRYIIKGVTDDEAKQVMLCSSRTYEELRDRLEFMGNAINAPAAGKNYNNSNNQIEVEEDESGDSDGAETWKTQAAISVE